MARPLVADDWPQALRCFACTHSRGSLFCENAASAVGLWRCKQTKAGLLAAFNARAGASKTTAGVRGRVLT
jgi:hypothetical protein